MADSEKQKALKLTLDKLNKAYGKGAIMRMGDSVIESFQLFLPVL